MHSLFVCCTKDQTGYFKWDKWQDVSEPMQTQSINVAIDNKRDWKGSGQQVVAYYSTGGGGLHVCTTHLVFKLQ